MSAPEDYNYYTEITPKRGDLERKGFYQLSWAINWARTMSYNADHVCIKDKSGRELSAIDLLMG